jgi:hypothetical protein
VTVYVAGAHAGRIPATVVRGNANSSDFRLATQTDATATAAGECILRLWLTTTARARK